ncbi:hypothetical protein ACFX2I_011868 [Malus domestica]
MEETQLSKAEIYELVGSTGTKAGLKLGLSAPVASKTTRWISAPASWAWARPSWVSGISPIYSFSSSMSLKAAWNRGLHFRNELVREPDPTHIQKQTKLIPQRTRRFQVARDRRRSRVNVGH